MATKSTAYLSPGQRVTSFIRLGRPLHLVGGVVFNGLGITIALYQGVSINWPAAVWCQIAITATQLMTHYSNDYFDQDADAATTTPTRWSGGSRVLPQELLPARAALLAALGLVAITLMTVMVLVAGNLITPLVTVLFILSLILAWSYSSPPLRLNRHGLGEVTGALLVPGLTTLIAYMVQAGGVSRLPLLAAAPLVCFQFAMLLSVNFPDAVGDARVGKRTLIVIFGPERGGTLFAGSLVLAYLQLPVLVWIGLPLEVALAILLAAPIAIWQLWRISHGATTNPARWNALAFWSIGLLLGSALLEMAAFVLLAG